MCFGCNQRVRNDSVLHWIARMRSNAEKINCLWKKIFESLVLLNNDHKIAVLLTYHSKSGQLIFGPNHVKAKMKSSLDCSCPCSCDEDGYTWEKAFMEDNLDLIHGMQQMNLDPSGMSDKYFLKLDKIWKTALFLSFIGK